MKIRSNVKAGGPGCQHNARKLVVRSRVRAGAPGYQHNARKVRR